MSYEPSALSLTLITEEIVEVSQSQIVGSGTDSPEAFCPRTRPQHEQCLAFLRRWLLVLDLMRIWVYDWLL